MSISLFTKIGVEPRLWPSGESNRKLVSKQTKACLLLSREEEKSVFKLDMVSAISIIVKLRGFTVLKAI